MKSKFLTSLFFGALTFHVLASGQTSGASGTAKSPVPPTKQMTAKNPAISGNFKNGGRGPMSVGGLVKITKGTGELAGTAVAQKH
jgi:hypothetical protein